MVSLNEACRSCASCTNVSQCMQRLARLFLTSVDPNVQLAPCCEQCLRGRGVNGCRQLYGLGHGLRGPWHLPRHARLRLAADPHSTAAPALDVDLQGGKGVCCADTSRSLHEKISESPVLRCAPLCCAHSMQHLPATLTSSTVSPGSSAKISNPGGRVAAVKAL